jgi:uncharacterized protein
MDGKRSRRVKVLADTSALLAVTLRHDQNHRAAARFVRSNPQTRYVITDLILSEVVTRIRARTDAAQAVRVADSLLGSQRYELIFMDAGLLRGALARLETYSDKRLSLPDCLSFEVMERLQLRAAFTFDRDFRDCGFEMLP